MKLYLQLLILLLAFSISLNAQDKEETPAWRTGVMLGANYNMIGIGYQDFTGDYGNPYIDHNFSELVVVDGSELAFPFLSFFAEYHSTSWWGAAFRISYDNRTVTGVEDNSKDRDASYDFTSQYLLFEPGLILRQGLIPELKVTIGPSIAMKLTNEVDYTDNRFPTNSRNLGDLDDANFGLGLFANFAYDIMLNESYGHRNWYLSPFIETSWILNQKAQTITPADQNAFDDIWSSVAVRFGFKASVEFTEHQNYAAMTEFNMDNSVLSLPPRGRVLVRKFEELFPIWQYVFFDKNSQEIPNRYLKLTPDQATNFKEEDLRVPEIYNTPEMFDRTSQQFYVYYNMMNVYGDRMRNDKSVTLKLVGSAPVEKDGEILAQKVKDYLVGNFGIDEDRIEIEGVELPRVVSGTASTPAADRPAAEIENRRVEFMFSDREMYAPVTTITRDESSVENDIIVAINSDVDYENWYIDIRNGGKNFTYGPYTERVVRINPVDIMKGLDEGEYNASIVIKGTDKVERVDQTQFTLEKKELREQMGNRFIIIFDYAQSDPIRSNETTIRETISKSVSDGKRVVVYGHTDNIGSYDVNKRISVERAADVSKIMDEEFKSSNKDIGIQYTGYGEQLTPSTFNNRFPEGRMYNRNVIIDVIPLEIPE